MNLTPLVRRFFAHRVRTIQSYPEQGEMLQRQMLARLIRQAARTAYGERYDFTSITSYESFAQRVPLNDYESLKTDIDRMRHGESSILWPGKVRWYAKSSGTTNDKSKFIPVSNQGLQQLHYAGGRDSVALYLHNNPESRLFTGKSLILGKSPTQLRFHHFARGRFERNSQRKRLTLRAPLPCALKARGTFGRF